MKNEVTKRGGEKNKVMICCICAKTFASSQLVYNARGGGWVCLDCRDEDNVCVCADE